MGENGTKRSRIPGVVNVGLAAACALVVALFALRASSSQPPAIAEFAPQAQQQIKQAPQEQTALAGTGEGGSLTGAFLPSPSPSATLAPLPSPPVDRGRVRHCVGSPPRQIDDPQSPPCVPYYDGPQPGATYKGVGNQNIKIVFQQSGVSSMPIYQRFFNQYFEFYRRGIHLIDDSADTADQRTMAATADTTDGAFGALDNNVGGGIDYADELAHRGLIDVLSRPYFPETYLTSRRPYVWSYPMATDQLERTMASWACARLKGQPATHAGPGITGQPRVYGLIFQTESADIPMTSQPFQDAVASCGIALKYVAPYQNPSNESQQQDASTITQLKADGVTSVFCFCDSGHLQFMGSTATGQAYYPEWLINSYILNDYDQRVRSTGLPAEQRQDSFGLSILPMQRLFPDHASTWADPSDPYQSDTEQIARDYEYEVLLLFASGIQMAGPNLTPQTFESGLQRTTFPNPDYPTMPGKVGFFGGSHAMTIDAAEIFWSNSAQSPYPDEGAGAYCYVDHGARHSVGNFPVGGDPFFRAPCDSGAQPAH